MIGLDVARWDHEASTPAKKIAVLVELFVEGEMIAWKREGRELQFICLLRCLLVFAGGRRGYLGSFRLSAMVVSST